MTALLTLTPFLFLMLFSPFESHLSKIPEIQIFNSILFTVLKMKLPANIY